MKLNKAILKEKTQLAESIVELTFKTEKELNYKAGQFITIKICDNEASPCFRAYSLASAPKNKKIKLCVKIIEGGRGSNWICGLNIGDSVEYMGPNGKFIFHKTDRETDKKILFVATGTGIAPFKAIIKDELKNGNKNEMELLFGLRHIKNIFYKKFFEKLVEKYKNFHFTITLSQPENESWNEKKGRVTDILKNKNIDTKNTEIYICGLKTMVDDVEKILLEKGVTEGQIYIEKY